MYGGVLLVRAWQERDHGELPIQKKPRQIKGEKGDGGDRDGFLIRLRPDTKKLKILMGEGNGFPLN